MSHDQYATWTSRPSPTRHAPEPYQPLPPYYRRDPEAEAVRKAAEARAERARAAQRRRLAVIGYSVVGVLVVGGGIASGTAELASSGSPSSGAAPAGAPQRAAASPAAAGGGAAGPTVSAEAVFSSATLKVGARTYQRADVGSVTQCAQGASAGLGSVLSSHGCTELLRATYTSGTSAIALGVAVLPDPSSAAAAAQPGAGAVIPFVTGSPVKPFCETGCAADQSTLGHFATYTVVGRTDGSHPKPADAAVANRAAMTALKAELSQAAP